MSQSTPFPVLVAALLLSNLSCCSADNVYCVTPTLPAITSCSLCPHNATHCATLSEYAQEAKLYFTSNTTMVFLPGDHILDMNITVANISRLTMCGESSSGHVARVACNGTVGFSFSSVVDFNTHSLTFTSCGRSFGSSNFKTTLLLESIEYAELVDCCFQDSLGTALTVYDTSITLAENSEFKHGRGGITALDSNLIFSGNTTFIGNDGSAVINVTNCCLSSTGSIHFINNSITGDSDHVAGAVWASTSSLDFVGASNFISNSINSDWGGAIYAFNHTSLNFNGTSNFINNSATYGGAICAYNAHLSFIGTSNFTNNSARSSGGAIYVSGDSTSLHFTGTSNFISNSVDYWGSGGGAIFARANSASSLRTRNFTNNSTLDGNGGGVYMSASSFSALPDTSLYLENNHASLGTSSFIRNSAVDGGAIAGSYKVSLSFTGISNFISNLAPCGRGGAIAASHVSLSLKGTSNFVNNLAACDKGGAMVASHSSVSFMGTSNFVNNLAAGHKGGAIAASHSSVNFTGASNFTNNSAASGGGIHAHNTSLRFMGTGNFTNNSAPDSTGGGVFLKSSSFSILPNTTVYWEKNRAHLGGAIYVVDQSNPFIYCKHIKKRKDKCFFQLPWPGQNLSNDTDVRFVFKDNSADAGSVLYGGAIDKCKLTGLNSHHSGEVFDMLAHIEDDSKNSNISSTPFRVCSCEDTHPNCEMPTTYSVYPGETFHVSLVTVGQRNGTVPLAVRSRVNDSTQDFLQGFQYIQKTNVTCTKLNYTVFSPSDQHVRLELYADGPCTTFSDTLVLQLHINYNCPLGFTLSKGSCVCHQRLEEYKAHCSITDGLGKITRDSQDHFWVGCDQPRDSLILHPHCPLDYCVSHTVEFPLNNTDIDLQCAYNRSRLLCGACKNGYSLVLGTSQCKQCSNNYLALLVPFALMGIALVFLLLICKLTVATGTLSGVLFYANIVGVNRTLFLPVETTNILSVFIAWLNLDFGIESCFYNGMDAYSKTWLQFVFPVYIWVIVGLLILVSHFSDRFAKLLGNNPVSVLATLILLSYAKILRTIIVAINVTYLEYPKYNKWVPVWLYDANINYLSGKHIPLFLVAICFFLFLFLPYTVLLLFGQWLQTVSHLWLFAWINRLKPFMDSYHAPYKAKHRYWPGLLLVIRFGLLLIFALNPQQDPSINLLAIQVGTAMLQLWAWISHGVYRNWCLDALEGSFALNLIILGAATMYINISQGNQLAVGYTSVTIALVTFIGILAYHIFQQVRATELWKMCPKNNLSFNRAVINNAEELEDSNQLREPLLEDHPQPNYGAF